MNCSKRVYTDTFKGRLCERKAWKDGFCRQHHPETVKARNDERSRRWQKQRANAPLTLALAKIKELEVQLERKQEDYRKLAAHHNVKCTCSEIY